MDLRAEPGRDRAGRDDGGGRDPDGDGLARPRRRAALLVAAGPLGMLEFGVSPVLQRLDLLGLAGFVLFAGAGRWSADAERGEAEPKVADLARAVWSLRVGAGLALIVVAFVEKLANPEMALAFLQTHPDFNVAALIGLPIGDLRVRPHRRRRRGPVRSAPDLGRAAQVCVLVAGIPFNATLWFFGTDELVGHLPVYGAMLVLLVYGWTRCCARREGAVAVQPPADVGALHAHRLRHDPGAHQRAKTWTADADGEDRLERGGDDEQARAGRSSTVVQPSASAITPSGGDRRAHALGEALGRAGDVLGVARAAARPRGWPAARAGCSAGRRATRAQKPSASGTSSQCQPVASATTPVSATPAATVRAAFSLTIRGNPTETMIPDRVCGVSWRVSLCNRLVTQGRPIHGSH